MLSHELHDTLVRLAEALKPAQDDWWIIGSVAVALHGVGEITVADVDVLMSVADAERLLPMLGLRVAPGTDSALFRSTVFATWNGSCLPVEIMAGFAVRGPTGWREIHPTTRECRAVGDVEMFVPSRAELLDLLAAFGRSKDVRRARLLAALG